MEGEECRAMTPRTLSCSLVFIGASRVCSKIGKTRANDGAGSGPSLQAITRPITTLSTTPNLSFSLLALLVAAAAATGGVVCNSFKTEARATILSVAAKSGPKCLKGVATHPANFSIVSYASELTRVDLSSGSTLSTCKMQSSDSSINDS
jgi:hypothetical protein